MKTEEMLKTFWSGLKNFIYKFVQMKIKYSKEADVFIIQLREGKPVDSVDLKEGVILHLDKEGLPLELEILDAAKLSMLNEISLAAPLGMVKGAS